MPESQVPAPTTRPRLLSDILEIPLSESATRREYTMHRPSSFATLQPSSSYLEAQSGSYQRQFAQHHQSQAASIPTLAAAPDPGVIGQRPHNTASSNILSQRTHLQPFTPLNLNENRRSMPNPLPVFATSPAVSESGSPCHSQLPALERSFSQTSLTARRYPSCPRTPTPSADGLKGKGRFAPRSSSLPSTPKARRATPHPHGKPSVKHLTCFWWKVKGDCRFSEEDCLYAHHDTGLLADAPRQVTPGGEQVPLHLCPDTDAPFPLLEPAKAGRHLEKALENLRSKRNPSSSSLNTSMLVNPSTPESQSIASRPTTPADTETFQERISSLQSDNSFFRNLVEQGSKEKSILMTTVEGLQKENSSLYHPYRLPVNAA